MNLLFVDDEPLLIKDLSERVNREKLGIGDIWLAYNVSEARHVLETENVDLIICDIEMPGENGFDLLNWAAEYFPSVKSLIVTSYPVFHYAQQALRLGCLDFLPKPIRGDELDKAIARAFQLMGRTPIRDEYASMSRLVRQAALFIRDHRTTEISRQHVADHVFLSPDHLDKLFRQELGLSVTQYIIQKRIDFAKKLLKESDLSISEVAERAGYNSQSNFAYAFKQAVGVSPRSYRLAKQEDEA